MSLLGKLFRASLRLKIVLPISLIIAVSLLLISGYLIDRQSAGYIQELEASGRTMLRMLAINAESACCSATNTNWTNCSRLLHSSSR